MVQVVNGSYHLISSIYEKLDGLSELQYHKNMREDWIAPSRDEKIIELGVGIGKNLPYYHHSNDIIAIDACPQMLLEARKKIKVNMFKSHFPQIKN